MRKNILVLSIVLIGWIAGASYWYVCKIRGNCTDNKKEIPVQKEELLTIAKDSVENKSVAIDSIEILKSYIKETGSYKIFFNYASHTTEFAGNDLVHFEKIKQFLMLFPDKKLMINGFSDYKGSQKYNLALSKLRAEFVKTKFVELGVAQTQIKIFAKGEINSSPNNSSENMIKQNRRVEISLN